MDRATGKTEPADPSRPRAAPEDRPSDPADAARDLASLIGELRAHLAYLVSARIDALKLSFRHAGIYAILAIVGLLMLTTLIVVAVGMVMIGLVGAVDAMIDNTWLAVLLVGVVLLGATIGVMLGAVAWIKRRRYEQAVRKYANKRAEQHEQFGHNTRERAREANGKAG